MGNHQIMVFQALLLKHIVKHSGASEGLVRGMELFRNTGVALSRDVSSAAVPSLPMNRNGIGKACYRHAFTLHR
jgi:hypothetical protein